MNKKLTAPWLAWLALVLVAMAFFAVNATMPPVMDDALYAHVYPADPVPNDNPHNLDVDDEIQTLGDVVASQRHHYFTKNGRALVHVVVQAFCGLWGKTAYSVVATAMLIALVFLLQAHATGRRVRFESPAGGLAALLLFFVLMPEPTCLYDGIAYGVNYLWSTAACLAFLELLFSRSLSRRWAVIGFAVLSFVAGWSHEGLVIAIGGGLLAWLFARRWRIEPWQWVGLVAFAVGAALLVFAPSNFSRAASMGGDDASWTGGTVALHLRAFRFMRASYVWLLLVALVALRSRRLVADYARRNVFWLAAWATALAFIVGIGALNARATFGVDFMATVLTLRLLAMLPVVRRRAALLRVASCAVLLIGTAWVGIEQLRANRQYAAIDAIVASTAADDCLAVVEDVTPSWWVRRYVCQYKFDEPWETWEQRVIAWTHRKRTLIVAEAAATAAERTLRQCETEQWKMAGHNPFYRVGNYLYTRQPLGSEVAVTLHVGRRNVYDPATLVRWLVALVRPSGDDTMQATLPVETFDFDGERWWRACLAPREPRTIVAVDVW